MALKNKKEKVQGCKSLYTYKNPQGQIHYYAEIIRNGKRYGQKNLTDLFGATNITEAKDALEFIRVELKNGRDPFDIKSDKLDNLFETRLNQLNEPTRTTKKYQYEKWIKPVIGHRKIGKITLDHLHTIMSNVDKSGNQASTKLALKEILSPIFNHEYQMGHIDRNILPLLKIKITEKKFIIPAVYSELAQEVKKLFNAINSIELNDGNTRALFLAALLTGRRIGELEQLHYSDIDFNTGWITPRPETTKTKKTANHIYQYPFPPIILNLLKEKKHTKLPIFSHHKASYTKRWSKMLTDNSINKTYTAHKSRHFFASIMSKHADRSIISEIILSHNGNIDSVYLTYSNEQIRTVYEQYWDIVIPLEYRR